METLSITQTLFKPHKKQLEFIEAVFTGRYSFLMYGGAAGGGKTYVSLAVLVLLAKMYPGSKWFVIRESLPALKNTSIPSFFKLVPRNFLKSFNYSENKAYFTNGSLIQFFAENYNADKELTRFDGIEANGFLIEEAQEINRRTFEKCKIRAGRNILAKQPKALILLTCNPGQGWIKEVFYDQFKEGVLPPDYFYLPAGINDNPYLPDEYKEALKNLDALTYARYIKGDWEVSLVDRPFAYAFTGKNIAEDPIKVNPGQPVYLSFDFNYDPITCIAVQSTPGDIRVLKEYRLRNANIYELCQRLNADWPQEYLIITGDATGRARSALVANHTNYFKVIRSELQLPTRQIKTPSVNPAVSNSRVLLNSLLSKLNSFVINKDCRYLIEDLRYVEVNERGEIDKQSDKTRSHLLDCLRYYCNTFHYNFIKR